MGAALEALGRIERLFNTLQDRLVAELELLGITDIDGGNAFIHERFLDELNTMFSVVPDISVRVWRKAPASLGLDRILSFRYEATVGGDNAIRFARNDYFAECRLDIRYVNNPG